MIVHTDYNLAYLPLPNRADLILSGKEAPDHLTSTAFMLPVGPDGIVLAMNRRRGMECAGGHIEEGETMIEAALRECLEEIGCEVDSVRPIGYIKMTSQGVAPDDWAYNHPESYQQFYAGRLVNQMPYEDNEECIQPTTVSNLTGVERADIRVFGEAAMAIFR